METIDSKSKLFTRVNGVEKFRMTIRSKEIKWMGQTAVLRLFEDNTKAYNFLEVKTS